MTSKTKTIIDNVFSKTDWDCIVGKNEDIESLISNKKNSKEFQKAYDAFIEKDHKTSIKILKALNKSMPEEEAFVYGIALNYILADKNKVMEVLENYTNTAKGLHLTGILEELENNYRKAIELYEKAIEEDENFLPSIFKVAYYADLKGDDEYAIQLYERGAKQNPTYSNLLFNLAVIYEDYNQYGKAIECYNKILDENPNNRRVKLFLKDAVSSTKMYVDEEKEKEQDKQNQILATPISDFELSVRSKNCLNKMKIKTLGDLIKKSEAELLSYKNFGETSLAEIKEILGKKGLKLGMGREEENLNKRKEKKAIKPIMLTNDKQALNMPISHLELSVRSKKCLSNLNVVTVEDLINKSENDLLECKNFGNTSMLEIKQKLNQLGLSLSAS